jgi:hypothetical protein
MSTPAVDRLAQAIVYGDDDRVDLYEADEPFVQIAQKTAVALIAPTQLHRRNDGAYGLEAPRYGELQSLCPGERFSEQPAAASCSGVLLAPNIVATAGHCLTVTADGRPDCTNNRYVLGFGIDDPAVAVSIPEDAVFECKQVLGRVEAAADAPCHFDFVLGEAVVVVGFPAGLPVKIDRGAQVIDARAEQGDFFTLSSDTFSVSSGSGVFDSDGALVGLFSRGRRDYDQDGSCQRVHREEQASAQGYEEATQIAAVQHLLSMVTLAAPIEPLEHPPACAASDYADIEPRARGAAGACTTTGVGSRTPRTGGSVLFLAVMLGAAFRRRCCRG